MRALIDGDILRYRIGFACEKTHYDVYMKGGEEHGRFTSFDSKSSLKKWLADAEENEDDLTIQSRVEAEPVENCLHSVKLQVESIIEGAGANEYTIYLSGKDNFRDSLVDYYKANRATARKPVHYEAIGRYLTDVWGAETINGEEADDALGIEQTRNDRVYHSMLLEGQEDGCERTIICSIDKDLDNIPGHHYNFVKKDKYFVDQVDADRSFYAQLISGDSTDNIPGLFQITGTRNKAILQEALLLMDDPQDMWEYVRETYVNIFMSYDEEADYKLYTLIRLAVVAKLRETGKLLWIRRERGEIWEPPSFEGESNE